MLPLPPFISFYEILPQIIFCFVHTYVKSNLYPMSAFYYVTLQTEIWSIPLFLLKSTSLSIKEDASLPLLQGTSKKVKSIQFHSDFTI
jgi:hypothetical protein